MHVSYLIIGAGPTGLGAGYRLKELGVTDFLLLERNDYVGGLAASFTDDKGFTWDIGGHVLFSHYEYYDNVLDAMLGDEQLSHQRIARVRMADRWIPYPFQNNIRHLPRELQWECVQGLLNRPQEHPENFAQWFEFVFGEGVARLFMHPYNFKVWATPPTDMSYTWIGERVSVVDLEKVLENLVLDKDDSGWGPNNTFMFPLHGGTGEIYRRMGQTMPEHIRTNCMVASLNLKSKSLQTTDGETITFDHLLSTGPLDKLLLELINEGNQELRDFAGDLEHNGVHVAGVGVDGMRDDDTCWMYFPEDNCPFYRLTNFHNYSPNNASKPGKSRALMAESSFSRHKPEDLNALMDQTVQGLVNTSMLTEDELDKVLSKWEMAVDYGYPVPTLGRDRALNALIPWLEKHGVYSRGRFGGWKYEVSNMDHSLMQGVEWAERLVLGKDEKTYKVER